jgi:transcriptional regulator with XRE-family HTH domain
MLLATYRITQYYQRFSVFLSGKTVTEVPMALNGKEAISVDVGKRLTQLRQERNLSMRAVARLSGLSANALSMIEHSKTSPSVSTLSRIAEALEIPVTAFFRLEPTQDKVVSRKASERTRIPFAHGTWEGLGGEFFTGHVEPFVLTVENGASSGPHGMLHGGHEFVLCLEGSLDYYVENQHFRLESGDSLLFASQMRHLWRNPGPLLTKLLIVLAGFGQDDHPSEYHLAASQRGENVSAEEMNTDKPGESLDK